MYAQNYALPDIILKSKKSIIPLIGSDLSWQLKNRHLGTGIVIGDKISNKEYILTCEHVISIKDSTNRTTKQIDKLYANFNLNNDSIIEIPLTLVYSDEKNDFALLEFSFSHLSKPIDELHKINLLILSFDTFDNTQDLKEGEPILYIGYPMSFGVGKKNYPVSRYGIVAQNIENFSTFMIDGFVQGGNSGSPVFRIKNGSYKLSGIAQAYPKEFAPISYQKHPEKDRIAIINPGFTIVKKIDVISEILTNRFGFQKSK
jgi:S1-C subfamily serine protease